MADVAEWWRWYRDTYVERDPLESQNDRNDRAIRSAVTWYQSHFSENGLDGVKVVLLTNDKAHLGLSLSQGIMAYTGTDSATYTTYVQYIY